MNQRTALSAEKAAVSGGRGVIGFANLCMHALILVLAIRNFVNWYTVPLMVPEDYCSKSGDGSRPCHSKL